MEDYVVPEFYDVLVGGDNANGSHIEEAGKASAAYGQSTASWDLDNGVTGKYWDIEYFDPVTWSVQRYNVYGKTDDEVREKILPYLGLYGDSIIASYGCK